MNLAQIANCLALPAEQSIEIQYFSIDSRQIKPSTLFVAIKGERFDGHDFIVDAVKNGAVAILGSRRVSEIDCPQLIVNDPISALATLATAHRQTLHCPVIALTGSNGKTTVKDMIASILPQPSLATKGNLNNHLGVPLSLLQLNSSHRYAVFELGANHPGDIHYTVSMVQPDVALINNIAPAHIEGFGSIDGVARTKGEIYQGLAAGGVAVVNDDDDYAHFWDEQLFDKKVLRFSLNHPGDCYAQGVQVTDGKGSSFTLVLPNARAKVVLQVPGEHNIRNALAAASCCYALGLSIEDIVQGLERFAGVSGRMTYLSGIADSTIIDDTYNANLRSVLTALSVLASTPGKKIFVFGDMGELGQWTQAHHREVGLEAARLGIDQVLTCGEHSQYTSSAFGKTGQHFKTQEALAQKLLLDLDEHTTVLVKGSRSSAMENIVHQLKARPVAV